MHAGVFESVSNVLPEEFHLECMFVDGKVVQRHELAGVPAPLDDLPFGAHVGDKAFDADRLLEDPDGCGAEAVIPSRRNRTAFREHGREMYKWRRLVENFFARIKEFRAIATRCDKTGLPGGDASRRRRGGGNMTVNR